MTTSDRPTAAPVAAGPPWSSTNPLTAYCCAERAAAAIIRAEDASHCGDAGAHERLLHTAEQWRHLAHSLATNAAMNRPRDDRGDERRSR